MNIISIPGRTKRVFLSESVNTGSRAHPATCVMGTGGALYPGAGDRGVKLIIQLQIVPILRMSGAVPPLCMPS
jgi:hypothetical protein